MKFKIFRFSVVLVLALIAVGVTAQTYSYNLVSPYQNPRSDDKLGAVILTNPALDTMDATPSDDTIFYYWPAIKLYNQYDLWAVTNIDTTAGNLGAHAGTLTIQQSPCLNCDVWTNVDTDNLLDPGLNLELTGVVNGLRVRAMYIATAGNFVPHLYAILKRE